MTASPGPNGRQLRLAAILFAAVILILGVAYYWFLARNYAVLATGVRPEEAAAIVDKLKKDDVPYELRDGGGTILVPASDVDSARLGVAGSDLPLKGAVGFELFNQSDMGLTDFAQKVNYQRALQGEIARTIMSMDGIAYARVHIALPERSLFRTTRSEPRAAVALTPRPGTEIDSARIAGIQRLVAATVPDLAIDQVAILDERGDLLTPQFSDLSSAANSESALEANYHDRVARAVAEAAPRAHVGIKVTVVPGGGAPAAGEAGSSSAGAGRARGHSIRIVLFEGSGVRPAEEQAIRDSVSRELGLDPGAGDQLFFSPAVEESSPAPAQGASGPWSRRPLAGPAGNPFMDSVSRAWTIALPLLGALAIAAAGLAWTRRRREARRALARRIRETLLVADGAADAA